MFKIAFPWAQHAEERAERDYLKTLESTSHDDVAGNVWISPEFGRDAWTPLLHATNIVQPSTWPTITVYDPGSKHY